MCGRATTVRAWRFLRCRNRQQSSVNGCSYPLWSSAVCSTVRGFFFFSSRRRHTRSDRDWSSDVCSSDLAVAEARLLAERRRQEDLGRPAHERRVEELGALADPELAGRDVREGEPERARSEERRVGKEGRSRWAPYH